MKKLIFCMSVFALTTGFSARATQSDGPQEVLVGVNDAYMPSGLDPTSNAFFVVSGLFPNSCYKYDHTEVRDQTTWFHEVRVFAQVTPGLCLMVMLPFHQEVELGRLTRGTHTFRFVNGDGTYMDKQLVIP